MPDSTDRTSSRNWLKMYSRYDPFPPRAERVLIYSQEHTFSSAAVAFQLGAENVWNLNSLFDPDQTGGGHQPYGFDQMAAIYARYRVRAVTIDIRLCAVPGQVNAVAAIVTPSVNAFVLTGQALGIVDEQPQSHVEILNSTGWVTHIRRRFAIDQIEGITSKQLENNIEEYGALVSANPARIPGLRVAVANMENGTMDNVRALVRLEFEAEFYDRLVLPPS